jgi:hypothetical protein
MDDCVLWQINIKKKGVYKVSLEYAAKSREARLNLTLDLYRLKDLVLSKTEANKEEFRKTTEGYVLLEEGEHILKITGTAPARNIIDLKGIELLYEGSEIKETVDKVLLSPKLEEEIILTPHIATKINRKKSLCVEWQNNPPNFGYISNGESFEWNIPSPLDSYFTLSFNFSTPQPDIKFEIYTNGALFSTVNARSTGGWYNYQSNEAGKVHLRKGKNNFRFTALSKHEEKTGNFRDMRLKKR